VCVVFVCGTNIWKVGSDGPTLTPSYIYHTYICIKLLGLYVLVVVVWYQYVLCAQYQSKHIITHAPACYVFWDLWCSLLLVNTYVYLECATCCWSVWPLIFYQVKFGLCVELLSGASTLSICSKQKSESSNENVNENENIVRSIQKVRLYRGSLFSMRWRSELLPFCRGPRTIVRSIIVCITKNHAIHQHADIIARNHLIYKFISCAAPVNMKCNPSDAFHLLSAILGSSSSAVPLVNYSHVRPFSFASFWFFILSFIFQ